MEISQKTTTIKWFVGTELALFWFFGSCLIGLHLKVWTEQSAWCNGYLQNPDVGREDGVHGLLDVDMLLLHLVCELTRRPVVV